MQFISLIRFGLGLVLSLLVSTGYAAVNAATANVFSDPAKSIMVEKSNPQFTITLASNPTTGYSWYLVKYDKALISLVKHEYQPPEHNMPGAGGKEIWTFKINDTGFAAPQISKIDLLYARPWNLKDNSKQLEFTVVTH